MAMPDFTLRQLLESGVHFGHHTRRWNPRMAPYLFGVRNQVHIIDLQQTVPMLDRALRAVRDVTAAGGRVLFVGTKRAAADYVADAAKRCGQYYVNHRWLGGMLTNFKTISGSIRRLRELDERVGQGGVGITKRELLELTRQRDNLERALGGIKEMGGLPDLIFVIDTNKQKIAIEEANKLTPKPQVLWMQLSVRNDEAAALAEANGMKVVMDRCPKIEYGRLSSEISWMGINSRTLSSKRAQNYGGGFQRMGLGINNKRPT